jgi:hypothetical protein
VPANLRPLALRAALALVLVLAAAPLDAGHAASASASASASAGGGACERYAAKATRTGSVPPPLDEISGIAASRRHPGVFWAHNDSNSARTLFAIDESGRILATFPLRGLRPRDAEDIAVGPCGPRATTSCIYLADVGDNLRRRDRVWIGRVAEPAALDGRVLQLEPDSFRFPEPRNAESLLVDPRTARLYVITKTIDGLGEVFRVDDLAAPAGGRAVRVATLLAPSPLARLSTGADAHPSGERIVVRTYGGAWELRRPGARSLEEVLAAPPVEVTGAPQLQSEGIAYLAGGRGYLLAAEGAGSGIYRIDCDDASHDGGAARP